MKYYSERTNKLYNTIDELKTAEVAKGKQEERRRMLQKEYKALEKELNELLIKAEEISKQLAEVQDEIDEINKIKRPLSATQLYNLFFD